MKTLRTYWLSLLFLALIMALVVALYDRLPDPMPSLWADDGRVIEWISKPMGVLLLPLLSAATVLVLMAAPALVPGGIGSRSGPPPAYPLIIAIIAGFLLFATSLVFARSLAASPDLPRLMMSGIGLLLALVGNYLGKLPKNLAFGFRTPWTLSSDHVWERTHRVAARVLVAGGLVLFLYCMFREGAISSLLVSALVVVTLVVPVLYSYWAWLRESRRTPVG
jgi:uncharacterized membrane protein